MKKLLLLTIFIVAFSQLLTAQGTCTDVLREAQQRFDDGLLGDISSLLEDCMNDGFTDEEKANAYKLLIQTHLFSEEFVMADEVMLEFLSEFPSYALAANDPTEFVNLYQTYRTDPIFNLEANLGLVFEMPAFMQAYGTTNTETIKGEYFANAGVCADVNYVNTLSGNFEYSAGLSFYFTRIGYNQKPFDYTNVDATFSSMMIGLPISIRYKYPISFLELYFKAGIEPVYLLSYSGDITREDVPTPEPYTGTENLLEYHTGYDLYPFMGAGVLLDLGRDKIVVSLGYKFGIFPQLKDDGRLKNDILMKKYLIAEDNLVYNKAQFSISYIRPIYNPKKIR